MIRTRCAWDSHFRLVFVVVWYVNKHKYEDKHKEGDKHEDEQEQQQYLQRDKDNRITVSAEVRKYLASFRVLIVNYFVLRRPPQQSAACGEWFNGSSSSSGINSNWIDLTSVDWQHYQRIAVH